MADIYCSKFAFLFSDFPDFLKYLSKMSVVTKLANGIKVATLNNGVKRAQVGVWSHGSGQEDIVDVGTMNMLSNCVNLRFVFLASGTSRHHDLVR